MKREKSGATRMNYAPDFKADSIRMLISGKRVSEIAETFGTGSNILYRWKRVSMMKSKSKSEENQSGRNDAIWIFLDIERKRKLELPVHLFNNMHQVGINACIRQKKCIQQGHKHRYVK